MRPALLVALVVVLVLLGWWVGGPGAQEGRAPAPKTPVVAPGGAPPDAAGTAPAPEPPPPRVLENAQDHALRVIDEDGAGIPGAWIEIRRDEERQARATVVADRFGRATLRMTPDEVLFVGAPGFMRARVQGAPKRKIAEVTLRRSYAIAGFVVDGAGAGLAGAALTLAELNLPKRAGASGPDGRFAFDDVSDDEMTLRVEADGYMREEISVAPGDTEIRIVLWKPVTVMGVVVFPDGTPAAGATVGRLPVGADGRFVLPEVRPGRIELRASLRKDAVLWSSRTVVEVAADGKQEPVRMVLEAAPRSFVRVLVLEQDGSPVAGVPVRCPLIEGLYPLTDAAGRVTLAFDRPAGTPARIEVDRKRDDELYAGRVEVVTGPIDGPEVVLRPREPLLVTVVVRLPDGAPLPPGVRATFSPVLRAVRRERDAIVLDVDPVEAEFPVGAISVPGFVPVDVRLGVPADGSAEIRLVGSTGGLCCRLVDEDGAAIRDGFVQAWMRGVASDRSEGAGSDGIYRLAAAPAGTVLVMAGLGDLALARTDAEVRAGEVTDLGPLVLRAPRTLAGRVMDMGGRPVGGARVAARGADFEREVFSRSDGSFRVVVPVWFDGRVMASKPGYGTVHRPAAEAVDLVLVPEGRVRLEVRLPPVTTTRALSYSVRDPATGFQWPATDRRKTEGDAYIVGGLPPGRLILVVETLPKSVETEVVVVAGATVSAVVHVPE